jgi:hypothetical protein
MTETEVGKWVRDRLTKYPTVKVGSDFGESWADGMAFCALVHSISSDAFDFSKLKRADAQCKSFIHENCNGVRNFLQT